MSCGLPLGVRADERHDRLAQRLWRVAMRRMSAGGQLHHPGVRHVGRNAVHLRHRAVLVIFTLNRQQRLRDWQAANPSRRLQNMGYQAPPAAPTGGTTGATTAYSPPSPNNQQSSLQPPGAFNGAIPTATRQQTVPSPRTGTGGGGGY